MSSTTGTPATATVVLRRARPEDYRSIGELTVAAYVKGGHMSPEDSYLRELVKVSDRAEQARIIVAEVDGVVAGSATLADHHEPFAEVSRPGETEFRMLAVSPQFQGRGVARQLVRHIVALAQNRPEITAVALCSLESMTTAHQLYRSEGFVEDPSRDFILDIPPKTARFPFFIRKVPR